MADENNTVFFDLETTDLGINICEITQLSAICGDRSFNVYILPRQPISEEASQITGLSVRGGTLFLRNKPLRTTPVRDALSSFIYFLRCLPQPLQLAAHNAKYFDAPIIKRVLEEHSLWEEFLKVVTRFVDTLTLSRELHPGLSHHSQKYLVQHFLGENYNAHNATEDTRMLQKLYRKWSPSNEAVARCSFTPASMYYYNS